MQYINKSSATEMSGEETEDIFQEANSMTKTFPDAYPKPTMLL
jgi:hypothetical protein